MNLPFSIAKLIDDWLLKNLNSFDPFEFTDHDTKFFRRKAFSELALYLFLRHRYNMPVNDRLLSFVLKKAGSTRYLNLPLRYPRRLLLYSSPLLLLFRCDKNQSHNARVVIEKASTSRALWAAERPAHRWFDLFYALNEANISQENRDLRQLIQFSSIYNLPCPIASELEDFYALTHATFYLTHFGTHNLQNYWEGFHKVDAQEAHELSICRYMVASNFDIVLELIISEYLLLGRLHPVATWAAHKIFHKLMEFGCLASPKSVHAETFADCYPDESGWARCYHTMLVTGLLCLIVSDGVLSVHQIDERSALIVGETLQRAGQYDLLSVVKVLNADLFDIDPEIKRVCRRFLDKFVDHHTNEKQSLGYWADEPHSLHIDGAESVRVFKREIDLNVQEEFGKLKEERRKIDKYRLN